MLPVSSVIQRSARSFVFYLTRHSISTPSTCTSAAIHTARRLSSSTHVSTNGTTPQQQPAVPASGSSSATRKGRVQHQSETVKFKFQVVIYTLEGEQEFEFKFFQVQAQTSSNSNFPTRDRDRLAVNHVHPSSSKTVRDTWFALGPICLVYFFPANLSFLP